MSETSFANRSRGPLAERWTIDDARRLYRVGCWGGGYFDISSRGHLRVRPDPDGEAVIDLYEVIEQLRSRGLGTPVVLRFPEILDHRLGSLHRAFAQAIRDNDYAAGYLAVYPIKVNQQRAVVEQVYRYGAPYGFGLEAGSKPELLAVLALTASDDDARPIVCNGFKDRAYIEVVTLATKLGRNILAVVESFAELLRILACAERYGVRPRIGVRVKLSCSAAGRGRDSTGAQSKFGLTTAELLQLVRQLREAGMLEALQMVHCHAGSQLQSIRRVKDAVAELAHVYVQLRQLGAPIRYLDVGGGLGVDYDGSRTDLGSSMNYSLQEYASEVVYRVGSICDEKGAPHPILMSESGRAVTAYHSVLVFDVLGVDGPARGPRPEPVPETVSPAPQPLRDLLAASEPVGPGNLLECYHDALEAWRQAMELFRLGHLTLQHKALAERLFWGTCLRVRECARELDNVPEELERLELILADTYFCNLSVFRSLPDMWAIGQLFPIMPIHRLEEEPTRRGVLADITCDSDGRIDRFTDLRDVRRVLELHPLVPSERYYLAALLVGAYQETLGGLHNLFGDTHVVHVCTGGDGGWTIERTVQGDTSAEVLGYVQYDADRLLPVLAADCERALQAGRLTAAESRALERLYRSELAGYTYLASE